MQNEKITHTISASIVALALVFAIVLEAKNNDKNSDFDIPEPMLSLEEAESILSIIDAEGFNSAFSHYSSYRDINDAHFHRLRQNYIDAAAELMNYISVSSGKNFEPPYYLNKQ